MRYIRRWISRKPLEIEAWLIQRITNRKSHMGYQMVTWRDVTPKVLRRSTVGYPSDSVASCYFYWRRRTLRRCDILYKRLRNILTYLLTSCCYSFVRVGLQTVETDELTHISVITRVWDWRFMKKHGNCVAHFRYRGSIEYRDTWDGIVIVAPISGIAQH